MPWRLMPAPNGIFGGRGRRPYSGCFRVLRSTWRWRSPHVSSVYGLLLRASTVVSGVWLATGYEWCAADSLPLLEVRITAYSVVTDSDRCDLFPRVFCLAHGAVWNLKQGSINHCLGSRFHLCTASSSTCHMWDLREHVSAHSDFGHPPSGVYV